MARYIDAEKLIVFANNSTVGVDANDIARFPTEDVAPVVHARWISKMHKMWGRCPTCSHCGRIVQEETNYCPNCGAKMDEEEWLRK